MIVWGYLLWYGYRDGDVEVDSSRLGAGVFVRSSLTKNSVCVTVNRVNLDLDSPQRQTSEPVGEGVF